MDMRQFAKTGSRKDPALVLREHTQGIRNNQVQVALIMLYLAGYEVELKDIGLPRASAAREALDELSYEGVPIWSCSTNNGGIWETWQRDALKYGDLDTTNAWRSWCLRNARQVQPA